MFDDTDDTSFLSDLGFHPIYRDLPRQAGVNSRFLHHWEKGSLAVRVDLTGAKPLFRIIDTGYAHSICGFRNRDGLQEILDLLQRGMTLADQAEQLRSRPYLSSNPQSCPVPSRYLEDYRSVDIGGSHFEMPCFPDQRIFMTYEKHVRSAFNNTMGDIRQLEHSNDTIQRGNQPHQAIAFWYLALESYINTLLKLCCLQLGKEFKNYRSQDLPLRLRSLLHLLQIDRRTFNERHLLTKVSEFSFFRNELFHDRHVGKQLSFKHTNFSPTPIFSSQVDVIQALLITLEVAGSLRFAITNLDTMPTTILRNQQVAKWEKLDLVYQHILQPFFKGVLEKHHLQTKLQFEWEAPAIFHSELFEKWDVVALLTVDQDPQYEIQLNTDSTQLGSHYYESYLAGLKMSPGTFQIASTMLDRMGPI